MTTFGGLTMKIINRLLVCCVTVVALMIPLGGSLANAGPESQFCAILVSSEEDNVGNSVVLSEVCAQSAEAAADELFASQRSTLVRAPLMYWYTYVNYGSPYTIIYGYEGTCDASGYNVGLNDYWDDNISSISGAGNCNQVTLFQTSPESRSIDTCLDRSSMPYGYNDNVASIQVRYRNYCP